MKDVIEATIILGEDQKVEIQVEGIVAYHVEPDYGSDADGNRGCRKHIIDDIYAVSGWDEFTEDEVILTNFEEEQAISAIRDAFLEG